MLHTLLDHIRKTEDIIAVLEENIRTGDDQRRLVAEDMLATVQPFLFDLMDEAIAMGWIPAGLTTMDAMGTERPRINFP